MRVIASLPLLRATAMGVVYFVALAVQALLDWIGTGRWPHKQPGRTVEINAGTKRPPWSRGSRL